MVIEEGVDLIGFITGFPESPRNLKYEQIKSFLSQIPKHIFTVIATKMELVDDLIKKINPELPKFLQLYGELPNVKQIQGIQQIKVLHADLNTIFDKVKSDVKQFDIILVDSSVKGQYGGTGITHNWQISKEIRDYIYPKPFILAGGLTPTNVIQAITKVKPYAVDVSSGVETNVGFKDKIKIRKFIVNAKSINMKTNY
jgi:phosphoribosylanthranilate isomerase